MDNPIILTIYDKLALDIALVSTCVTIVACTQVVMTGCLLVLGVGTRGGGRRMAPCYPGQPLQCSVLSRKKVVLYTINR